MSPSQRPAEGSAGALFEAQRGPLFAMAYRMLGCAMDAEDLVQDAWLRWQQTLDQGAEATPRSAGAWLRRTGSRLAIDRLRRRRLEPYPGPWLPEPIAADASAEPMNQMDQLQGLQLGMLLMLERLSPEERVTLVLRDSFHDDFRTIAQVLEAKEATCRQYYKRAQDRLAGEPRFDAPDAAAVATMLEQLLLAFQSLDRQAIRSLFDDHAVAVHDGGGVVSAAIRPIEGPERIMQVYLHLNSTLDANSSLLPVVLLGEPALAVLRAGELDSISTMQLRNGRVAQLLVVRNPAKLRHLARSLGVGLANS